MQSCQLPSKLVPGDLVCVVSTSGALQTGEKFEAGLDIWRQRGYKIQLCEGYDAQWGYLAGTDQNRREQLKSAFKNPECKAILCSRGGYGGTRLLEDWSWPNTQPNTQPNSQISQPDTKAVIKDGQKWLIGFSDITSLLWSQAKYGVSGLHGPVLTTLSDEPVASQDRLFRWVEQHEIAPIQGIGWADLGCGGQASGILLPGNLCVATCLLGTPAEPDFKDVILAFEDVGEAPYRLDRMLTQWRAMGKFQAVKGIALGRFSSWQPIKPGPTLSVETVMRNRLADLNIPIVSDFPFGHDGENAALPVGRPVTLDANQGSLSWAQCTV